MGRGVDGDMMGDKDKCVAVMLYADDLALMTNSPREMQTMLSYLRVYAERKGLTVDTARSEVVHFNNKSGSCLSTFTYNSFLFLKRTSSNI